MTEHKKIVGIYAYGYIVFSTVYSGESSQEFVYRPDYPDHLKSCRKCMQVGCDTCITFCNFTGYEYH